jgi:hypothetical protein
MTVVPRVTVEFKDCISRHDTVRFPPSTDSTKRCSIILKELKDRNGFFGAIIVIFGQLKLNGITYIRFKQYFFYRSQITIYQDVHH